MLDIDLTVVIAGGVFLSFVLLLYALIPQGDEKPKYPTNGCDL